MKTTHGWTIGVEHRSEAVGLDHLFYKSLRCELIHTGTLPVDLRIEDQLGNPNANSVRVGGAPEYTVLLGPAGITSSPTPSGTLPPAPTYSESSQAKGVITVDRLATRESPRRPQALQDVPSQKE